MAARPSPGQGFDSPAGEHHQDPLELGRDGELGMDLVIGLDMREPIGDDELSLARERPRCGLVDSGADLLEQ